MQMNLLIESPTFKEGNKWKFFDGQSSLYADILDEVFLKKVDSGEVRFGKGDSLTVNIRLSQTGTTGKLSMERTIIKVLKHEEGIKPDKLF